MICNPRRGLPSGAWMLQIMDTRIGFPCPFRNVVIDYFSPTLLIYNKNPHYTSFQLYNAQHHDTAAFGDVILLATSGRHNILGTKWQCKNVVSPGGWDTFGWDNISPDMQILGTDLSPVGEWSIQCICTHKRSLFYFIRNCSVVLFYKELQYITIEPGLLEHFIYKVARALIGCSYIFHHLWFITFSENQGTLYSSQSYSLKIMDIV